MKNILILFFIAACTLVSSAQEKKEKTKKEVKTIEFKVEGNCEQCKKRIENAAFIKGVKNTNWNMDTKMLKVIYRTDKVTEQQIYEAIAKSGHETEKASADKAAYDKLPNCCKYKEHNPHVK